jgi:hydroxymethylglutaryl-CoA lyase
MADAAEVLAALRPQELARTRVLVPNLKGLERAVAAGAANVLVNVGVTEGFNRQNLNRSVDETLADIAEVVREAGSGVRVDASISVAWGCPYDGPVAPAQVMAVADRLAAMGVRELSFGDTIGVATPSGVRALAREAMSRFPALGVAMHLHDTRGMGLANTLAALECGVRAFEGSIGGIGGCPFAPNSTGNVCSEDLLALVEDAGLGTGIDVDALIAAARALSRDLGKELPGRLQRAGREPWRSLPGRRRR